jgi:hypothetical protein
VAHVNRVTVAEVIVDKPWTADDERLMLELRASGLTWRVVAQKLSRTEAATISRAGQLKARELDAKKK